MGANLITAHFSKLASFEQEMNDALHLRSWSATETSFELVPIVHRYVVSSLANVYHPSARCFQRLHVWTLLATVAINLVRWTQLFVQVKQRRQPFLHVVSMLFVNL